MKHGRLDTLAKSIPEKNISIDPAETRISLLQAALNGQCVKTILESQEPDLQLYRMLKSALRELLQSTDRNQQELVTK